jgi:hypothetical protein
MGHGVRRSGRSDRDPRRLLHHSPVLTIRGDSYRLRAKRRSGLFTPKTTGGEHKHSTSNLKEGAVLAVEKGAVPGVG